MTDRTDKVDWVDIAMASGGALAGTLLTIAIYEASKRRVNRGK